MSVFVDYSKAFDTIQHETLIKKLTNLNFSNSSIQITISYLINRQQYVQLDDKISSYRPIYLGVPQSSTVGPVLFNTYVSLLPSCLKTNSIRYANDTSVYLSNSIRNIQSTISIIEIDIKNLNTWYKNNGLVFNNEKLFSVLFTSKRTVYDRSYLMKSSDKSIKQKPTAKLLSITFDCNLTWNNRSIL